MSDRGTFEAIIGEIAKALKPLSDAQQGGAQEICALFREAGIDPDLLLKGASVQDLISAVNTFATLYGSLSNVAESGTIDVSELPSLISATRRIIDSFSAMDGLQLNDGVPAICQKMGEKILNYLVLRYLHDYQPKVYFSLLLGGIADDGQESDSPFLELHLDRIPKLLADPGSIAADVYKWGTNEFRSGMLLLRLNPMLAFLGIPSRIEPVDAGTDVSGLDAGNAVGGQQLRATLYEEELNGAEVELGLAAVPLDADGSNPKGIGIVPFGTGEYSGNIPLDDDWTLKVKASSEAVLPWGVGIRPNGVGMLAPSGSSAPAKAQLHITIERDFADHETRILFGEADGPRVELGTVGLKVGLEYEGELGFFIELPVRDLRAVISAAKGDGFLRKILPKNGIEANFDLALGISSANGVYFKGCTGLEISLATHISLGPLEFQSLTIALKISDGGIPITAGATIKANLGPLKASIDNMGIRATFSFPENNDGNLGPVDLALGFKPPNGIGLAVDAGVVKGGGYLYFDFDREEYAGALELVFSEWIALKAIGLITTKMPDGSKGFSLLIIITVEFGTGFQLGFGFALLGVGGLLGLNRIVKIDPLKEGIRTGAVESVMFPKDVVANAPRIISDLRRFFPPQQDIFLVGPMAKIGWGTPTLMSAQIGVILEFPSVNITILGVIKVVLPDEEADVLRLQVNFIGRVEPSNQLMWFYAELYESRVLFITLEGGMGLLVNWGDNANFIVSVGGFHPRYSPPPLPFPEPPRIAANILNESWARVRIEGYFAVTSNSVQFGARAELFFGLSAFKIEGHLAFDALFQFNPFFFIFSLSFSLSVKVFGIGLWSVGFSGLLEGPTPWHIKGKGKISLFFFSISVPFEHTWGEAKDTKLDPIEVYPLLETEFNALTNWEALVPKSSNLLVSLRKLGESKSDRLVLHPVGKLRISQRKVPVNFKLDKIGNQRPSDFDQLDVDASLPGGESLSVSKVEEKFAIGQFKDLDGSKQMSSPAFEPLESGIEIGVAGEQMKTSRAVRRVIRYETIIIDNNFKRHVKTFFGFFATGYAVLNDFLFAHFLKGNAVSQSVLSKHHKKRMQPFDEVIQIKPNLFSVAYNTDNRPIDAGATTFTSQAKALEHMERQIENGTVLANSLHVIPNTELSLSV